MKSALVFGAALCATALAAGSIAYVVASQPASGPSLETASLPASAASAPDASHGAALPGSSLELANLRDDLARLSTTVRSLQAEVESLRSASTRETMAEPEAAAPQASAVPLTQLEQSVRDVLAAERQRERDQQELERIERERQQAQRTAERVGERLSLAPADTTRLATHLVAAQDRFNLLRDQMRDSGLDRDGMRSSFEDLRTWNQNELVRLFGQDLGAQIGEQTNPFGGGRGGGFGGQGERGGRQPQFMRIEGGG
jgi:DNA repair exonuclease SbcCD ATPase subunit